MKKSILIFAIIFLWAQSYIFAQTGNLQVKISGFENRNGDIKIAVFAETQKSSFTSKTENASARKIVKITSETLTVNFENLPYGTYAVSVFHDENSNLKMDRNSAGIPVEDYGFSNNVKFFGPPKFEPCKFELKEKNKVISIEMTSVFGK